MCRPSTLQYTCDSGALHSCAGGDGLQSGERSRESLAGHVGAGERPAGGALRKGRARLPRRGHRALPLGPAADVGLQQRSGAPALALLYVTYSNFYDYTRTVLEVLLSLSNLCSCIRFFR